MKLPVQEYPTIKSSEDPKEVAVSILERERIPAQDKSVESIVEEVVMISNSLRYRWKHFCSYQNWLEERKNGTEPVFWDEDRAIFRSSKYALAPCQLINSNLNRSVGLVKSFYSPQKMKGVMAALLSKGDEHATLRNVAIHAEEAMEQEALKIALRIADEKQDLHRNMVLSTAEKKKGDGPITLTELLESLVVFLPRSLKLKHPEQYPELPFPYFINYIELVKGELQLLSTPAIQQNPANKNSFNSFSDIMECNPILKAAHQLSSKSAEIKQFISGFPELFGHRNIKDKIFTFVGAGFPLTGVILHIETGALINLIDYDREVVETAKKFLELTDKLGITRPGSIKVMLADARDLIYLPTSKLPGNIRRHDGPTCSPHCPMNQGMSGKRIVPTDILDLASALSPETTSHVININASLVPTIRKRNVRGMSELLYERYELKEGTNFRLAGEVTPPQKVISGATPAHLVTGFNSTCNVNSCQLLLNTCNFGSKLEFLEGIVDYPEYRALREVVEEEFEGCGSLWDSRVIEFYNKRSFVSISGVVKNNICISSCSN